ncbi:MAG TPA: hypothetical protein VNM47_14235 [Terriglobia bacterium]|nr:hypothetical protein [Terriglobia bacterium]
MVIQVWQQIIGDKFLLRPRLSRIYYRRKFFLYPLVAEDALLGFTPVEGVRILLSYLCSTLFPTSKEDHLKEV